MDSIILKLISSFEYQGVTVTVFSRGSDFCYRTSSGIWGAGQESAQEAERHARTAIDRAAEREAGHGTR